MVGFQDTESVPAPWRAGNESYELHPVRFDVDDRGCIEQATAPPGNVCVVTLLNVWRVQVTGRAS